MPAILGAEALLVPAKAEPAAARAVASLIETAMSPFAAWSDIEEVDDLASAWLIDAMLQRPMWAIKAGLRTLFLSARFRPTPAEMIAAVDAEAHEVRLAAWRARKAIEERPVERPKRDPRVRQELLAQLDAMMERARKEGL